MKNFIVIASVILSCAVCLAESKVVVVTSVGVSSTTAKTNETNLIQGELDGFYIDVAAGATNGVVITSGRETLLSVSGVTADTIYRVRFPAVDATGGAVATSTNNKAVLSDKLTIVATATSTGAADVKTSIIVKD